MKWMLFLDPNYEILERRLWEKHAHRMVFCRLIRTNTRWCFKPLFLLWPSTKFLVYHLSCIAQLQHLWRRDKCTMACEVHTYYRVALLSMCHIFYVLLYHFEYLSNMVKLRLWILSREPYFLPEHHFYLWQEKHFNQVSHTSSNKEAVSTREHLFSLSREPFF